MKATESKRPGKVLFISHEASLSGAPIALLHLLKWIAANTNLQFEILLLAGGPLKADFENVAPTLLLENLTRQHSYSNRLKKKIYRGKTVNPYSKAAASLIKRQYNLIYGNTVVTLPLLTIFKESYQLKTLCCIHELSYALNYFFTDNYLAEKLASVDTIIAVSNTVKQNLVVKYQLTDAKVKLHYEFIETSEYPQLDNGLRSRLGLGDDELIIGMGGDPSWRKGTDLIIPLTIKLLERAPHLKFKMVWLGGNPNSDYIKQLTIDAGKCGIGHKLSFVGQHAKPLPYINLFDIFVLLSREDPFPLIALEAAFLKKPVVAFENAGGIPELLNQGAGFTAAYLNIDTLAEIILKLANSPGLKEATGEKGHQLVVAQHSANTVSPAIHSEIFTLLNPTERMRQQ